MRGIAGEWTTDGEESDSRVVRSMLEKMPHRHGGLIDTLDVRNMNFSFGGSGDGWSSPAAELIVVCDARIDDADELARTLGLPAESAARPARIIGEAYLAWGESFVERLDGDFALVIGDGRSRRLLAARDRFGARPLVYAEPGSGRFAFASETAGLLARGDVPDDIDHTRIADFLSGIISDDRYTFRRNVKRLEPAHLMTVDSSGTRFRRYWTPREDDEVTAADAETNVERFAEIMTRAVEARTVDRERTVVLLSGGLDSSAIVGFARVKSLGGQAAPVSTLTMTSDAFPEADERRYIRHMVAGGGIEPTFVDVDHVDPLQEIERLTAVMGEPFFAPGLAFTFQLKKEAARLGKTNLVSGHGGDEVVSLARGYARELFLARRRMRLLIEALGHAWNSQGEALEIMGKYWRAFFRPELARLVRRVVPGGGAGSQARDANERSEGSIVARSLGEEVDLEARIRAVEARERRGRTERDHHRGIVTGPAQPRALEILEQVAASLGTTSTNPMFDRSILEFCLSLPPEQKRRFGKGRLVMRRAMKGLVPEIIRTRNDKTGFARRFVSRLEDGRDRLEELVGYARGSDLVRTFVDVDVLESRMLGDGIEADTGRSSDASAIIRCVSLFAWLESIEGGRRSS